MKLLGTETSPFVRKVRMMAMEKGLEKDIELVVTPTKPMEPNPDLTVLNPLAKVPCLLTSVGPIVDSRVICRYLDQKGGGARLYDETNVRQESIVAYVDGAIDAGVAAFYEMNMRPEAARSEDWAEAQWQKARRAIRYINDEFADELDVFNMSAMSVVAMLEWFELRFSSKNWQADAGNLMAWLDGVRERASVAATRPPKA